MEFSGSMVALITPFKSDSIDYQSLEKLIEWHIQEGTQALVLSGTTGESATLSVEEKKELIRFGIKQANGRIPIIAGTGSNNTKESLALTQFSEAVGVNAVLLVSPYYNKPSPEGLYQHYATITQKTELPCILYNVPGRTAQNIPLEVLLRLDSFENIVAVKEATSDLNRVTEVVMQCKMKVLSGEDSLVLPMISLGATGVISVVANIVPKQMVQLVQQARLGNFVEARKKHQALYPLCRALFLESNPIPVKYALSSLGKIEEEYRLPLCSPMPETKIKMELVLKNITEHSKDQPFQFA